MGAAVGAIACSTPTYEQFQEVGEPLENDRHDVLRLLIEHRNSLFGFIFAAVRDHDAAEEVLQEVSVAVCESSGSFQVGTNFGAWAREIARRRVLAYWRQRDARPALLSDELLQNVSDGFRRVEEQSAPIEQRKALRTCLAKLEPTLRQLIEQRYAKRISLGDLAVQMGRKQETVRKSLYRARMALRKCIEFRLASKGAQE
ncbi:sigma-70 family RNA polymerase sigma factor [Pirellulimonas nuda]|nr:sigma-70 family RNA polymerase sigma factor [Pirellulimonas nuda]